MNFNNGAAPRAAYNNFDPNSASSKMDIDSKKVGMVIGRGGGKIREIQDNFNVHVKIGKSSIIMHEGCNSLHFKIRFDHI